LTPALRDVHELVPNNFKYKTDKSQYNKLEHWVEPDPSYNGTTPLVGDCEDFALACRKLLRDRGIESVLIYCRDETGAGHLVLESNGFVLDNRQRSVVSVTWLLGRYTFLAVSGKNPGDPWREVLNGG